MLSLRRLPWYNPRVPAMAARRSGVGGVVQRLGLWSVEPAARVRLPSPPPHADSTRSVPLPIGLALVESSLSVPLPPEQQERRDRAGI